MEFFSRVIIFLAIPNSIRFRQKILQVVQVLLDHMNYVAITTPDAAGVLTPLLVARKNGHKLVERVP